MKQIDAVYFLFDVLCRFLAVLFYDVHWVSEGKHNFQRVNMSMVRSDTLRGFFERNLTKLNK